MMSSASFLEPDILGRCSRRAGWMPGFLCFTPSGLSQPPNVKHGFAPRESMCHESQTLSEELGDKGHWLRKFRKAKSLTPAVDGLQRHRQTPQDPGHRGCHLSGRVPAGTGTGTGPLSGPLRFVASLAKVTPSICLSRPVPFPGRLPSLLPSHPDMERLMLPGRGQAHRRVGSTGPDRH